MATGTLAIAALAATAIGGGVAAYSSYQQGQAAEAEGKYNAQVERINSQTLQQQNDADLQRVREKYRRVRGSQIAAGAASGLASNSHLTSTMFDTNLQEDLDILSSLYKTKIEITGSDQRRGLALMQGASGKTAGTLGAVGTVFSTGGSMYGAYPTLAN